MFKLTLMILIANLMCFSAYSKSYIRTHEDFNNMSNYEKDQLIIQTMELVVELESKYNYEVKKFGFNQERFEKFQQAIVKIQSFLLSSAHAQEVTAKSQDIANWNRFATNFNRLFSLSKKTNSKSGATCIFAGWPSTMYKARDGQTYCAHPGGTTATLEIKSSYPTPVAGTGCSKKDTSKIQCNPTLFGFKKASNNSLFCVTANDGAKNSAYHCMMEALKETSDDTRDSKEDRLAIIRQGLSKNPEAFKSLQEYVYQVCVCPSVPKNFDKSYQSRILPHRTCYGMMDMMGEVTMCSDPNIVMDTSIFKALRDFAKTTISQSENEVEVDNHYRKFVSEEVIKNAPDEYRRLCGPDSIPGSVTVTDQPKDPPGGTPAGVTSGAGPGDGPVVPGGTPAGVGGGNTDDEKKYTCTASCPAKKDGSEVECEFKVADDQGTEVELKDPKYTPPEAAAKDISVTGMIEDKEVSLSCSLEDKSDGGDKTDDGPKPTLTITITKKEEFFYSLKAVTKDDKGWSFAWSFEDTGTLTVDKGWAEEKEKKETKPGNTGIAPDSDDVETTAGATAGTTSGATAGTTSGATAGTTSGATSGSTPTPPEKSDSKEIPSQKRYTVSYKVCGQLTKGAEKIPKEPSCVTIDKLNTVMPKGGAPQGQNQQGPIRGSSDTSAIGIR